MLGPAVILLLACASVGAAAPVGSQVSPSASDPRQALQRAVALVQEGRLEAAGQQAERALSDPETRAAACSVLGAIRVQQKRLDEAAELLEEAVRLAPGLLGAQLNLAQVHVLRGEDEAALGAFRRVLELDPSNEVARFALARAATEKGQHARSLELARPVRAAFEASPEGVLILAANHLGTGDAPAAAALARQSARFASQPPAWSLRFAQLLVEGGLGAEAIDVLERARDAHPDSHELAVALGGAYLAIGSPAWALESYDRALELEPDALPVLRQAAAVAERHGQFDRALSYWQRARELAPDDPENLLGFGRVCLRMDLLEDADETLTRAAALRPDDPDYQYPLAVAKVGRSQYDAAQALLEPLVRRQPGDAQLQYALGTVLYNQGHLEEAAEHLEESLRLEPEQAPSAYYLALVARDEGRDAEAIQRLEELLQRHPDHALSCEALGGLLMNERRYAEAERHLRKAIHLAPRSMRANYQLGLLLARTGRQEEADRQLELAKTLREEEEASSRLQFRLLDPGGPGGEGDSPHP